MVKDNESKKTKADPLNDLTSFLDQKIKDNVEEVKPEPMTDIDMENFFNQKIIPVFKKIKKRLEGYTFDKISFNIYSIVARFRIYDTLSDFVFKVEIDNGGRQVRIFYELKYRNYKRRKFCKANTEERMDISFTELDKINDQLLLTLFTKWYMSKDELIQKVKDWKKKKEQEDEN